MRGSGLIFKRLDSPCLFDGKEHVCKGIGLCLHDLPLVRKAGDARIDGHARNSGNIIFFGERLCFALAEDLVLLAAIGTGELAHVLDKTQNGHVHHFRHIDRLFDDHFDEILRRGDDDDPA